MVSPVGLCPLYFHADDSCRPAFVMHDTMHFYFHFATRRKPGSAFDDSLLQSDSIFAKRRRAEEPLRRRPNYIIPPFFFSQWKRRRDPWKGISFIFFLSFAFSCFHSSLSLLIPNIEQRYPRKRKTEIAITACLIFDES